MDGYLEQLKAIYCSFITDVVPVLQFFICRDEQCLVCRSRESTDTMYLPQALLFIEIDETLFDSGAMRNILKLAQLREIERAVSSVAAPVVRLR